jgi:hypothetical protein
MRGLLRPLTALLVGTALVAALVAAATVTSAAAASKRPTPKQWAKGVCTSINTWISDVESTVDSLGSENSLEDAISTASDGIKQATDELVSSLHDLGLPQTKNSKQAKQALDRLGKQLDNDAQKIKQSLNDVGNDPVDIASTFADIGTIVQKAVDQVQAAGDALQGLDRNGALQKALKSSPACKQLENAI